MANLRAALDAAGAVRLAFRVIRSEGRRAVVEVEALDVGAARAAWNRAAPDDAAAALTTRHTWGTLRGAKAWLARDRDGR